MSDYLINTSTESFTCKCNSLTCKGARVKTPFRAAHSIVVHIPLLPAERLILGGELSALVDAGDYLNIERLPRNVFITRESFRATPVPDTFVPSSKLKKFMPKHARCPCCEHVPGGTANRLYDAMVRHLRGVHGIEAGSTLVMTGRDEKRLSEEINESQLSTPASLVYESTPGSSSACTPAEYSYGTYRGQKRSRDLDEDEDEEPRHQRTRSFDFSSFCADEEAEFTPYDEECGSFHTSGSQPTAGPPHSIGPADLVDNSTTASLVQDVLSILPDDETLAMFIEGAEAFLFGPVTEHAALLSDNSEVALAETFHAYDQSTYFGGDMQLSAGVPPMLVSTGDGQVNFENSSMAQHHGYYAGPTYGEYSWNTASLDLSSFAE